MKNQSSENLYNNIVNIAGWGLGLIEYNTFDSSAHITPTQRQLASEIFSNPQLRPDAVYFSGDHPLMHVKRLTAYEPQKVFDLHKRIWNEGRSPLLTIITSQEIRVYDTYDKPGEDYSAIDGHLLYKTGSAEHDLEKLAQLIGQAELDSGKIWQNEIGVRVKIENKVDRTLIRNLRGTRKKLLDGSENREALKLDIVHDLLGRTLFTLYLEDRGILVPSEIPGWPSGAANVFDLLERRGATYKIFEHLKRQVNGDLFPISEEEKEKVQLEHLNLVRSCFFGHSPEGQQVAFSLFDFNYIRIELLSAIYEEFMGAVNDGQLAEENGAFYTKPMLVEFLLNEVLPWPDENPQNQRYDLRILDPACGSGIFLSESYRRLIARWRYQNDGRLTARRLQTLLGNIYGIEKDEQAIKVAAFSLYLTFLSYLEPEKIRSDYINGEERLEPLIRWSNPLKIRQRKGNVGNNLYEFSTFNSSCELTKQKFDLIVGNPPWKKNNLDPEVKAYKEKHDLPEQIACNFMHFIPTLLNEDGLAALVVHAKILFNTGRVYEGFRRTLFTEYKVRSITNFSILRDILFEKASAPAAVLIYSLRRQPMTSDETVIYCVPKHIKTIGVQEFIIIDSSEIKLVPVTDIVDAGSKVLKITMWGGLRDVKFIKKLKQYGTLKDYISDEETGMGLIRDKTAKEKGNSSLEEHLFLATDAIQRYYTPSVELHTLKESEKTFQEKKQRERKTYVPYRTDTRNIYKAPLVIIPEGANDDGAGATFIDYNTVFQSSSKGISLKMKDGGFHKALTAYFNSKLASYFFFMTCSNWKTAKGGQIQKNELMELPGSIFSFDEEVITQLADKVDELIAFKKEKPGSDPKNENLFQQSMKSTLDAIDDIIFRALNITKNERILIDHVFNSSGAFTNCIEDAFLKVDYDDHLKPYAKTFVSVLNTTLKHGGQEAWVEIFKPNGTPVSVMAFHFNNVEEPNAVKVNEQDLKKTLSEINLYAYKQHSESIYFRRVYKFFKKDTVYWIQPNERRFWSKARALHDADELLVDLITAQ